MRTLPAAEAPVVVANGADPIGAAVVRLLAATGHPVSFGYRDNHDSAEAGPQLESELTESGHNAASCGLDALDSGSLSRFHEFATARFGPPLCIVANSAAGVHPLPEQAWDSVVEAGLSGAYRLVRKFLPAMLSKQYGRVVLVGSAASVIGQPREPALTASAAALEGLVRSLAVESAPNDVLVNAVALGYMQQSSELLAMAGSRQQIRANTALRRAGKPTEAAEAIRFLCGSEMSAVTGSVLRVDGGLTA